MAHYALLNMANVVTKVIAGPDENETDTNWELYYQDLFKQVVKRTSYNTSYGKLLKGKIPFRKNYAGKGFVYDYARDAFIPPKPYESWTLDANACNWVAPKNYPTDGKIYCWDEENQEWKKFRNQIEIE